MVYLVLFSQIAVSTIWSRPRPRPGNPMANCPEDFRPSAAADHRALLRDESTYSTNVFLLRFVRHKIAGSEIFFALREVRRDQGDVKPEPCATPASTPPGCPKS